VLIWSKNDASENLGHRPGVRWRRRDGREWEGGGGGGNSYTTNNKKSWSLLVCCKPLTIF